MSIVHRLSYEATHGRTTREIFDSWMPLGQREKVSETAVNVLFQIKNTLKPRRPPPPVRRETQQIEHDEQGYAVPLQQHNAGTPSRRGTVELGME